MKRFLSVGFLLGSIVFALVVIPSTAFGGHVDGHTGLVPCDGADCGTCDFMKLGNNVLQFFVQLAVVIAGLMFAWGGLTMVMSAGESGKVSEAKGMMTSAIVGILIVLAAWLLVDTLLKMVLKGGETGQIYGVWQEIQCSTQTEGRSVPDGQVTTGSSGGSVAGVGNEVKFENGKYSLHTTQTDDSLQKNYDKVNTKYASQISTACEGSTIPNCTKVVTALIANESAGDTEITNSEGAQGIMQILEKNGGKTCAPNNTACIQEQISKGVDMLDQSFGNTAVKGSVANMLAAYNGGGSTAPGSSPSGKNPPLATSVNCDGLFAYQCNISPGGLKETQGYVANICKTLIMNGSGC